MISFNYFAWPSLVKRGFSVSSKLAVENLKNKTVVACQFLCHYIKSDFAHLVNILPN